MQVGNSIKKCAVLKCVNAGNPSADTIFFPFPKDSERCLQWLTMCNRSDMLPNSAEKINKEYNVCSLHFTKNNFVKHHKKLLIATAVPTNFTKEENLSIVKIDENLNNDCNESISVLLQEDNNFVATSSNETYYIQEINDITTSKSISVIVEEGRSNSAICRLCSKSYSDVDNMFEIFNEFNISEKINLCLPICVLPSDALPKTICKECFKCLQKHLNFHQAVLESEDVLKQMFDGFLESNIPMIQIIPQEEYDNNSNHKSFSNSIHNDHLYAEISSETNENTEEVVAPDDDCNILSSDISNITTVYDQNVIVETLETINDSLNNCEDNKSEVEIVNIINTDNNEYDENSRIVFDSSTPMYMCNLCNGIAPDLVSLFSHSIVTHLTPEDKYICVLCDSLNFTTEDELFQHMNLHQYQPTDVPNTDVAELNPIDKRTLDFGSCDMLEMSFNHQDISEQPAEETYVPKSVFSCTICNKKFKLKSRIEFHMKFHRGEEPGYCSLCDKRFPDENLLFKHVWYLHNGGAEKRLSKNNQKTQNKSTSSGDNCLECGMFFSRKTARLAHEEAKHGMTRQCYSCFYCLEAFATTELIDKHMESEHTSIHIDETNLRVTPINRLYQCEYCFRLFTKPSALHAHRTLQHSKDPMFTCRYCSAEFSTHRELLCHIAWSPQDSVSHNKEDYPPRPVARKVFHCYLCSRMFQALLPMINHMETHKNDLDENSEQKSVTQHSCHHCLKPFSTEASLVKHIRVHTGERPYVCDVCGKSFSQSSGLTTHSKVHTNERPYSCDHCSRAFKIKGDRDVHQRTHSGDRPFKCSTCEKTFMTQQVYSQHCKIHTNHRPYVCKICKASFRRSHVLTVHKLRHSGEKPHRCELCDKQYRQRSDVLKHMKVQHGITSAMLNNKKNTT